MRIVKLLLDIYPLITKFMFCFKPLYIPLNYLLKLNHNSEFLIKLNLFTLHFFTIACTIHSHKSSTHLHSSGRPSNSFTRFRVTSHERNATTKKDQWTMNNSQKLQCPYSSTILQSYCKNLLRSWNKLLIDMIKPHKHTCLTYCKPSQQLQCPSNKSSKLLQIC